MPHRRPRRPESPPPRRRTGAALGTAAAVVIAFANQQPVAVPLPALVAGPVVAVVVGAVAGLHPAMRAARTPPTQALKGV